MQQRNEEIVLRGERRTRMHILLKALAAFLELLHCQVLALYVLEPYGTKIIH